MGWIHNPSSQSIYFFFFTASLVENFSFRLKEDDAELLAVGLGEPSGAHKVVLEKKIEIKSHFVKRVHKNLYVLMCYFNPESFFVLVVDSLECMKAAENRINFP